MKCTMNEVSKLTSSLVPSFTPGHFVTAFWWQRLWTTHVQTVDNEQKAAITWTQ